MKARDALRLVGAGWTVEGRPISRGKYSWFLPIVPPPGVDAAAKDAPRFAIVTLERRGYLRRRIVGPVTYWDVTRAGRAAAAALLSAEPGAPA